MSTQSNNLEDLRETKRLLSEIRILKRQIFGEITDLPTYCMACGVFIGVFVLAAQTMAGVNVRPLCEKCFKEKVGTMVMPKDPMIY